MFLACDVGNSSIKVGVFKDDELVERDIIFQGEFDSSFFSKYNISAAAVSSVNKSSSFKLIEFIKYNYGIIPFEIDASKNLNLKLDYETPKTLGVDRLCGAEGAFYLFQKKKQNYIKDDYIISIDFGTATTFNLITYKGIFAGGLIAPGISLMIKSLSSQTAQLPEVSLDDFYSTIGKSTKSSIASGVIYSTAGMINSALNHLQEKNKNAKFHIYVTGGNAEKIIPYLEFEQSNQPALVLYGIKSIYGIN